MLMGLMVPTCGMPIIVPKFAHGAVVHGAAILGGKAASTGGSEHLWSIMYRMSKPRAVMKPGNNEGESKLLGVKCQVFLEQCGTQQVYIKYVDEEDGESNKIMVKLVHTLVQEALEWSMLTLDYENYLAKITK
jgi:hypothetical protein